VTVRLFTPADAAAFRQLNEQWIVAHFELEPKDNEVLNDPEGKILAEGGAILIAEEAGGAVGCVALLPAGEGVFELAKMAVRPDLRGHGLGRALIEGACAEARARGAHTLMLESNTSLKPAIALYEKMGFVRVPLEGSPYVRCDVRMVKTLGR
jgi:GNAT superfamily N-acetyltransferase